MKIWIFSSGLENLSLLNILKQYNFEIVVYMNQNARPIEDKTFEFQQKYVDKAIDFLLKKNVEKIILPPVWELKYVDKTFVLPIFQNFISQSLKYTLVWKIWIIWNKLDSDFLAEYLKNLDSQTIDFWQTNKKIEDLKIFKKDVSIWNYNLPILSKRNWMLRKLIKTDLRYFFDCQVDTLIASNYAIFHFERLLKQKLKKIRFQTTWTWDFLWELAKKDNNYNIEFYSEWNAELFLQHKRRKMLLK